MHIYMRPLFQVELSKTALQEEHVCQFVRDSVCVLRDNESTLPEWKIGQVDFLGANV